MDQTISSHQGLLWNTRERGQDPNLDRYQRLPACHHPQEETKNRPQSRRNLANAQHHPFAKVYYESRAEEFRFAKRIILELQPIAAIPLINGHY